MTWPNLPDDIRIKAVEIARQFITSERAEWIREQYAKDNDFWITTGEHFGYGMALRNAFHEAGLTDDLVPLDWDRHYQEIAEIAVGITREGGQKTRVKE